MNVRHDNHKARFILWDSWTSLLGKPVDKLQNIMSQISLLIFVDKYSLILYPLIWTLITYLFKRKEYLTPINTLFTLTPWWERRSLSSWKPVQGLNNDVSSILILNLKLMKVSKKRFQIPLVQTFFFLKKLVFFFKTSCCELNVFYSSNSQLMPSLF